MRTENLLFADRANEEKTLTSYFRHTDELPSRNFAIMEALEDGYTQREVARHLGVFAALMSHVFRRWSD